jgi:hypothetical protein
MMLMLTRLRDLAQQDRIYVVQVPSFLCTHITSFAIVLIASSVSL